MTWYIQVFAWYDAWLVKIALQTAGRGWMGAAGEAGAAEADKACRNKATKPTKCHSAAFTWHARIHRSLSHAGSSPNHRASYSECAALVDGLNGSLG